MFDNERMRTVRQLKQLSQAELGIKSGIAQTSVSEIELGKTQPSFPVAVRIADALNLRLDDLVMGGRKGLKPDDATTLEKVMQAHREVGHMLAMIGTKKRK